VVVRPQDSRQSRRRSSASTVFDLGKIDLTTIALDIRTTLAYPQNGNAGGTLAVTDDTYGRETSTSRQLHGRKLRRWWRPSRWHHYRR
jgi:hypothetical protein